MIQLVSAALLLTAGLASAATAQDAAPDVHVGYRDLDLGKQADVKRLDHRIASAIAQVCPDDGDPELGARVAIRHCREAKQAEIATQRERALDAAQPSRLSTASTH